MTKVCKPTFVNKIKNVKELMKSFKSSSLDINHGYEEEVSLYD